MLPMRLVIVMLAALALSLPAKAAEELTVKASKYSVKETLNRLTAALKDKGITRRQSVDRLRIARNAQGALQDRRPRGAYRLDATTEEAGG